MKSDIAKSRGTESHRYVTTVVCKLYANARKRPLQNDGITDEKTVNFGHVIRRLLGEGKQKEQIMINNLEQDLLE